MIELSSMHETWDCLCYLCDCSLFFLLLACLARFDFDLGDHAAGCSGYFCAFVCVFGYSASFSCLVVVMLENHKSCLR